MSFCEEDETVTLHLYDRGLKCMVGEPDENGAVKVTHEEWLESRGLTDLEFRMKFGCRESIHVETLMERGQHVFWVPGEEGVTQGIEYKDGRIRILENIVRDGNVVILSESHLVYDKKTGVIRGEMNCGYPGLIGWRELWLPRREWGRPMCAAQCLRVK